MNEQAENEPQAPEQAEGGAGDIGSGESRAHTGIFPDDLDIESDDLDAETGAEDIT